MRLIVLTMLLLLNSGGVYVLATGTFVEGFSQKNHLSRLCCLTLRASDGGAVGLWWEVVANSNSLYERRLVMERTRKH